MQAMKKIWKFMSSMKFALILLVILAAACSGGSFITQGQSYEWYTSAYSETAAAAIKLLGLDHVFTCWWFIVITVFLCVNLLLCNVLRAPHLVKRFREMADPAGMLRRRAPGDVPAVSDASDARKVFEKMGFRSPKSGTDQEGRAFLYAYRHRAGLWGAWLCHLGILILIAGFALGQMTKREYTVYGVPGQSRPIGDTHYALSIDSFEIGLRGDDTVEQYTSGLTMYNIDDGSSRSAQVSVNHPATLYGMKLYQNSTGYAADIAVLKDGKEIQRETVCAGEVLEVEDKEGLAIAFMAFYPDYYMDAGTGPMTRSSAMNNPGYLYQAYYQNQIIGMNVLTGEDVITIDEYTVVFSDPQSYTLIQIKQDRFTPMALAGGLIILAGLFLAFYLQSAALLAWEEENGSWRIVGECRKGGALFEERLAECITPERRKPE